MAEIPILETQLVEGFAYSDDFQVFAKDQAGWFTIEMGKSYRVVWDGAEYVCEPFVYDLGGNPAITIGNKAFLTGESSSPTEPFAIGYLEATDYSALLAFSEGTSHTVGVYEIVAEEVGIVQYDRAGNRMEFYGKDTLRVDTTDGGTMDFVHADLVEKTVELDFSNGDMAIETMTGELFKKVIIPTPATLIPGHIAEGVNVAGIIGTMAGGAHAVFASGTFSGLTGDVITINHDLGVTPDMILIYATGYTNVTANHVLYNYVGFSKALATAMGNIFVNFYTTLKYATVYNTYKAYIPRINTSKNNPYACIDHPSGTQSAVYGANEESFEIHNKASYPGYLDTTFTYNWVAIGGLT